MFCDYDKKMSIFVSYGIAFKHVNNGEINNDIINSVEEERQWGKGVTSIFPCCNIPQAEICQSII